MSLGTGDHVRLKLACTGSGTEICYNQKFPHVVKMDVFYHPGSELQKCRQTAWIFRLNFFALCIDIIPVFSRGGSFQWHTLLWV